MEGNRYPELLGVKGGEKAVAVCSERQGPKPWTALETVVLECRRGEWKS